jgi:TolA-binding protein
MNNLGEIEQCEARIKELDELVELLNGQIEKLTDINYELEQNMLAAQDQNHYYKLLCEFRDKNHSLQQENSKLRQALKFTTKAAIHLFKPDQPLEKGLPPFFYHTTTYEGDLELIENTKLAMELIKDEG